VAAHSDRQAGVCWRLSTSVPVDCAGARLNTRPHPRRSPQAQHQVQGGLLLDVVVRQGAAVLQLLAGEDEALLVRGDAFGLGGQGVQVGGRQGLAT